MAQHCRRDASRARALLQSLAPSAAGLGLVVSVAMLEQLLDGRTWLLATITWTLWIILVGLEGAAAIVAHRSSVGRRALVAAQVGGLVLWLVLLGLSLWLVAVTWDLVVVECFSSAPSPGQPLVALVIKALAMLVLLGLATRAARGVHQRLGKAAEAILLITASLGLLLLGGEAGFRLLDDLGRNSWEVYDSPQTRRPGAHFIWRGHFGLPREMAVEVTNNRYGYHADEWSRRRQPGIGRIAMIGDSFVEAYQVERDATVHHRLGIELTRAGSPTEVLGFGCSGIGPVQELELLRGEVLGFKPDLVLLAFLPSNDVRDSHPELRRRIEAETRFVLNRGPAYVLARYLRLGLAGWALWQADRTIARVRRGAHPSTDSLVYLSQPADAVWTEAWHRVDDALLEMRDQASTSGARFGVVVLTSALQLEASAAPDTPEARAAIANAALGPPPAGTWDLTAPDRHIERLCHDHGIPVILLNRELSRLPAAERTHLHLPADGHWTALGHRLAARCIAQHLLREGLVP